MGRMETKSAVRRKRADIRHLILSSVGLVGIVAVALIAPAVLTAMDELGMIPKDRQKEIIKASRNKLLKQGYLKSVNGKLRMTDKGCVLFTRLELKHANVHKRRKWDGRWRMLIFDIPEHRKGQREQVRRTLSQIGFVRLQDSVWLYPYDCEDFIVLLKADFHIGRDLLYLIVDSLESDKKYREHFGLPRE